MGIFNSKDEAAPTDAPITGNETIDKQLNDAQAAADAQAAEDEQRRIDAEETARVEREGKKLGGEYVRCIVSHATPFSNGIIHICGGTQQFNIRPDEEIVVPAWVPDRLMESFHPVFDKKGEKQTNKKMYSVQILEKDLTQYHYRNFLAGKDKKKG